VIRVLIVDDEPFAADTHASYVARLPGFTVGGRARTGADALRLLAKNHVDLVLLDLCLPDLHGLDVVRAMRAAGHTTDVIVVTKARDFAMVRAAVSYGIVHYLIKPFTFSVMRDKLERYLTYRSQLTVHEQALGQDEIDQLLETLHGGNLASLRRRMSRESLDSVVAALRSAGGGAGMSATEVAGVVGVTRVTARRYLEYLAETGLAARHARYRHSGGRPEVEFRWRPSGGVERLPPAR
jgi:response regulator of citrate/malate metabolism